MGAVGRVVGGVVGGTLRTVGDIATLGTTAKVRAAQGQQKAASKISDAQLKAIQEARSGAIGILERAKRSSIGELGLAHSFADAGRVNLHNRVSGTIDRGFHDARRGISGTRDTALRALASGQNAAESSLNRLVDVGFGAMSRATTPVGTANILGGQGASLGNFNLMGSPAADRGRVDLMRSAGARLGNVDLGDSPVARVGNIGLMGSAGASMGEVDLMGMPGAGRGAVDFGAPIESDPGFQFELEQGQRALGASASARGGRSGGRFAKEMARFSQGLASTRAQDVFNRRMGQAGLEQQELSRLAQLGTAQAGLEQQGLERLAGLRTAEAGLEQQGLSRLAQLRTAQAGLEQQGLSRLAGLATTQAGLEQQDLSRIAGLATSQAGLEQQALARRAQMETANANLISQSRLAAQNNLANIAQQGLGGLTNLAQLQSAGGAQLAGLHEGFGRSLSGMDLERAKAAGMLDQQGLGGILNARLNAARELSGIDMGTAQNMASVLTGAPLQGQLNALAIPAQTAGGVDAAIGSGIGNIAQLGAMVGGAYLGGPAGVALAGGGMVANSPVPSSTTGFRGTVPLQGAPRI